MLFVFVYIFGNNQSRCCASFVSVCVINIPLFIFFSCIVNCVVFMFFFSVVLYLVSRLDAILFAILLAILFAILFAVTLLFLSGSSYLCQ